MHYIHLFHPYNILKHNYFFYKQFVLPIILSLDKLDLTKAYNINNHINIPKKTISLLIPSFNSVHFYQQSISKDSKKRNSILKRV